MKQTAHLWGEVRTQVSWLHSRSAVNRAQIFFFLNWQTSYEEMCVLAERERLKCRRRDLKQWLLYAKYKHFLLYKRQSYFRLCSKQWFCQKWLRGSHNSIRAETHFSSFVIISWPIWVKLGIERLHITPFNTCDFCKNWCSKGVNKIAPAFSILINAFGKNLIQVVST